MAGRRTGAVKGSVACTVFLAVACDNDDDDVDTPAGAPPPALLAVAPLARPVPGAGWKACLLGVLQTRQVARDAAFSSVHDWHAHWASATAAVW